MSHVFSRMIHVCFYTLSLFIIVSICIIPISIGEKIIHSFAWIYLTLTYAYFFDESPPKILRIEYLYGASNDESSKNAYLDKLLSVSQESLSLMRKIQLHQDYQVVNHSISELKRKQAELKKMTPPKVYTNRHREILEDVQEFLSAVSKGDYRVSNLG